MISSSIFISLLCFVALGRSHAATNDRPIIGIVTEELYNSSIHHNATSSIYASYVKFIESSGARAVPIWIRQSKEYYKNILSKINGVLFPGGGVDLKGTGYGRTGKIIFDLATMMNDRGDYFPLWGTCLGFELMGYLVAGKNWMEYCDALDVATNLIFTNDFKGSKMFREVDSKLENSMKTQEIVYHYHFNCFSLQNFSSSRLDQYFRILALNQDLKNMTYVSIIEARNYPYYGVSFHPEKVLFEWPMTKTHKNIPHSLEAVRVSQYFGNFFVNEARKNGHHFSSIEEEHSALIYNYNPEYTGKGKNKATMQIYFFE